MTLSLRQTALNLLARREHSITELRRKLTDKDFDSGEIEALLARLIQENLLSDERFTESFIQSRISKGFGPLHIRADLRERGIAATLIADSVKINAPQWRAAAQEAQRKRFGRSPASDYRKRVQQGRFLQQRGFTMEQITAALKGADDDE